MENREGMSLILACGEAEEVEIVSTGCCGKHVMRL
jgi:hypothetical protein